jgi:isopentenyl phosphate kinase
MMKKLIFLKLGGSLITDKDQANTALFDRIDALAVQIVQFRSTFPDVQLLIGHGSGSFGHTVARQYQTRNGVSDEEQWQGFAKVWQAARALNQIVIESFARYGLPVLSFPLSSMGMVDQTGSLRWPIEPIQTALHHSLLPIIYGDVVFSEPLGGTIFSTEEQFSALVPLLHPNEIFLAGIEPGVWLDFPHCTQLIEKITPQSYPQFFDKITGSASVDVTGGMATKVQEMLALIQTDPDLQIHLFSGKEENAVFQALSGNLKGTILQRDE